MLSQKAIEKIRREASEDEFKEIYSMFHKYNLVNYLFSYITNHNFRKAVKLHDWIKPQIGNDKVKEIAKKCIGVTHDITMLQILGYYRNGAGNLKYIDDLRNYGTPEYWATVEETLSKGTGDCEDGACLVFLTALEAGIPEYRLYFTIGWVDNNGIKEGHAYVVYIADNLVQYPMDWCYWTSESMKMSIPYFDNSRYFYGSKEWARFNTEGTYKIK